MLIKKIVDYVNRSYIASDYLRAPDIYYYMDLVIDDINDELDTHFPILSEWEDFVEEWNKCVEEHFKDAPNDSWKKWLKDRTNYDAFPDNYIRKVLAAGTAYKFYTRDEEGGSVAETYMYTYNDNKFKMVRDYLEQVPIWFQNFDGGYSDFKYIRELGPWIRTDRVMMRGFNTRNY